MASAASSSDSTAVKQEATGRTVAGQIPFAELCGFLERVQKKKGNDVKRALFKDFLDKWRTFHKQLHENNPNTVGELVQNGISKKQVKN